MEMTYAKQMLETTSSQLTLDAKTLAASIEACFACAQACTACADACLDDRPDVGMAQHVRRNLDCADICIATGNVLSRQAGPDAQVLAAIVQACVQSCRSCAAQCGERSDQTCALCVEACQRCEQTCSELLAALGSA
jgi:hypothetical protein